MWTTIAWCFRVIGGIFSIAAVYVSLRHINSHLTNYHQPEFQKYICRILLMVPLYGVLSWFSMLFPDARLWFDTIRDAYEGYVLYSFMVLLINYVGGERRLMINLELKSRIKHPWPFTDCIHPFQPGRSFLRWTRACCLQFVFVKPCMALCALILHGQGLFDDGSFALNRGFIYVFAVNNVSVTCSMYALVLFFLATEDLLEPYKPLPKFLIIKSVIFFTWWQGVILLLMVQLGFISDVDGFSGDHLATIIQELLICIEMLAYSLLHCYVFSHVDYQRNHASVAQPILHNFKEVLNAKDVINDAKHSIAPAKDDFELEETKFSKQGTHVDPLAIFR
eukprot:GILI01008867.1.p1 GENE.GILI01008867.1~~GILI01008867.1.p1  ORF type:complete len:336 (+),score=55.94 GILI01008867.1:102-1109(+)